MKQFKSVKVNCIVALFVLIATSAFSQTSGTLTFSCSTTAPNGTWGTKHVLAVWLENTANPSVFIKTKAKYGNEDDHLTSWVAKSGKNLVDATTGATLVTYSTIAVAWNGTNTSSTVVPDGTYNIYIEMGWGSNKTTDHSVQSFSFVKGPNTQHLTPAATTNYSSVVIDWNPVITLVGASENFDNECLFPNPTNGIVNIKFSRELQGASLNVVNPAGKTILSERNVRIPTGTKAIDLGDQPNGLYFITIQATDLKYTYKVLINK
jgi:hypothetical protein